MSEWERKVILSTFVRGMVARRAGLQHRAENCTETVTVQKNALWMLEVRGEWAD